MNLERQKENFKNHVASFTDYGNIKILDFANPDSSNYRIRFLFEEDYCRLHISGDLGELIATNYNNMRFDKFGDFVNNVGYFESKVNCHSRAIEMYDEDLAKQQLKARIKEDELLSYTTKYDWCDDEDERIEEIMGDVFDDFSDRTGIGSKGYDALCDLDCDAFEWGSELGKKDTGILDLYMLAFKLAMEQIEAQRKSPINMESEPLSDGWIYCNDRLPETTDNVLIATSYGVVLVAFYGTNQTWRYGSGKKLDNQDEPVAWMPMPQFVK